MPGRPGRGAKNEAPASALPRAHLPHSASSALAVAVVARAPLDDPARDDRASLTPWESFVLGTFGYSLLDRENATAGVRAGRFLATYLEPVGGLEWVPRPYVRRV